MPRYPLRPAQSGEGTQLRSGSETRILTEETRLRELGGM